MIKGIATGVFKGNVTGDVSGDVSGNITGTACTFDFDEDFVVHGNGTITGILTYDDEQVQFSRSYPQPRNRHCVDEIIAYEYCTSHIHKARSLKAIL